MTKKPQQTNKKASKTTEVWHFYTVRTYYYPTYIIYIYTHLKSITGFTKSYQCSRQCTTVGLYYAQISILMNRHEDAHTFSAIDHRVDQQRVEIESKIQTAKPLLPNQISIHDTDWFKSHFWFESHFWKFYYNADGLNIHFLSLLTSQVC